MTQTQQVIDSELDALVGEWLTFAEATRTLGIYGNRIKQWIKERKILAVYREGGGGPQVPRAFFTDEGEIIKGLPGTLSLLADAGFSNNEALRWLFTDDDLPGAPVQALAENRGTEVRRRAQALAL